MTASFNSGDILLGLMGSLFLNVFLFFLILYAFGKRRK